MFCRHPLTKNRKNISNAQNHVNRVFIFDIGWLDDEVGVQPRYMYDSVKFLDGVFLIVTYILKNAPL